MSRIPAEFRAANPARPTEDGPPSRSRLWLPEPVVSRLMQDAQRPRFPRRVYSGGAEPDARFSLANERTFLAWTRTALAFFAAGVALEALAVPMPSGLRLATSLVLIATGLLAALQSWRGWMRSERALRHGSPLPAPAVAPLVALGLLVVAVLLLIGLFTA